MRKLTIVVLVIVMSLFGTTSPILDASKTTGYKIQADTGSYLDIEFSIKSINVDDVSTEKGVFSSVTIDNGHLSMKAGSPALPTMHELIAMPYGATPEVEVISYDSKIYKLSELGIDNLIVPAQPGYSKSSKPEDRVFVYNEAAYSATKFNSDPIAVVSKSGTMRGVGVGVLKVYPFKYNPTAGTIEVYNDLKVRVNYVNADPRAEEIKAESYSPYFESSYNSMINYKPSTIKADLMNWPVTYLIVASDALTGNADLQRLIDWKTEKGFNVVVDYVSASSSIFTNDVWVEQQWNNLTPKPSFILLIGDADGTFNVESQDDPPLGSTGSVSISDLEYAVIGATGSSNRVASMYVGRFNMRTTADLTAQVDKTIWYEKEQFTTSANLDYLTYPLGVAGVDASFAPTHGDPHISYGWTYYFTSANGMANNHYYLSDTSDNSTTEAEIVAYISAGANFYNYTAHGMPTYFAEPEFTIADIDGLNNAGEYPLVIGNCCLTNTFDNTECFGEAWLNAPNKGAIGYIGASMSTYWDEDLAMGVGVAASSQVPPPLDTSNPGFYDGVMALGYSSSAAIKHVGLMAVEALNTTYTDDYWSSYHLMGDPSVQIYFGIPGTMTASHDGVIAPGATTYTVTTTPFAYVAMGDQDGNLHGAAQANSSGVAAVPISTYTVGDTGKLVITAQFKQPYFEDVLCTGDTGGNLAVNQSSMNFGNVTVGGSSTMQFMISNSHNSEYLMGDITTITGYTVGEATKNVLTYSVGPNSSKTFDLVFEPVAMTTYSGNIVVTSSDPSNPSDNISVTGVGALPDINLAATTTATCDPNESVADSFIIQNTGVAGLNYSMSNAYVGYYSQGLTAHSNDFATGIAPYTTAGEINWVGTGGTAVLNASGTNNRYKTGTLTSDTFDASGCTAVSLQFTQNFTTTAGSILVEYLDGTWQTAYSASSSSTAAQDIAIPITATQIRFAGTLYKNSGSWTIDNVLVVEDDVPYSWLTFDSPTSGLVDGSSSNTIDLTYDATGLVSGDYEANITVASDDPDEPAEVIAVTFTVGGVIVTPPDVPANIVTSISGSNLIVDWDVSANATSYDVYSSDDPYGTFTFVTNVATNQYTVAADQAKFFYYIVAKN